MPHDELSFITYACNKKSIKTRDENKTCITRYKRMSLFFVRAKKDVLLRHGRDKFLFVITRDQFLRVFPAVTISFEEFGSWKVCISKFR